MEATLKYRAKIIIGAISPYVNKGTRVLDIGCGNGVVSTEISKHFGCAIFGTDVKKYLKKNIKFKMMPREDKLDWGDHEFDIGLFNDVVHHIPSDGQIVILKEALRVCNRVLLFELEPTLAAKIVECPMNWINNPTVPLIFTHRTKENWAKLFRQNDIDYEYRPIKKPSFWYPCDHFLFCLKPKDNL